jgi:hypothetical protein
MDRRLLAALGLVALSLGLYLLTRGGSTTAPPGLGAAPPGVVTTTRTARAEPRASTRVDGAPAAVRAVGTSTRPASSRVVVEAAWGSALGQVGRRDANESNPEGPMALVVQGDDVLLLDQANARVQRFRRGVAIGSFQVGDTAQDVALGPSGTTVVLDRLVDKSVTIHGPDGARLGEIPLAGKGLEDPSDATGVFVDDQGVWVEREHASLVRVATADGASDEARPEVPGRPTEDGRRVVTAALGSAAEGTVLVTAFERAELSIVWAVTVQLSRPIVQLMMLETDAAGQVYLAAEGARERADLSVYDVALMIVRLAPDGAVSGVIELPWTASGDEVLRPLTLGDDGAVYVMAPTATGVAVSRHTFP